MSEYSPERAKDTARRIYIWILLLGFLLPTLFTVVKYAVPRLIVFDEWMLWRLQGFYGLFIDLSTIFIGLLLIQGIPYLILAEIAYNMMEKSAERNADSFLIRRSEICWAFSFPIFATMWHHILYLGDKSLRGAAGYALIPWVFLIWLPYGYFMGWLMGEMTVWVLKLFRRAPTEVPLEKSPLRSKSLIDVHVHLAALPEGSNGCRISSKMLNGFLFKKVAKRFGLPLEDAARTNTLYLERLVETIRESEYVKQAVVLAMDGVYDSSGILREAETDFLITNDYIFDCVARYPNLLLPGVSINPQRADAVAEVHRCADKGAVLIKVLPNAQRFNPAHPSYIPFWQAMAERKLPLLCHTGYEFSLIGHDQSVGDPSRLRTALDQGVTVISAHGASFGLFFYEKYWDTFRAMVRKYPHLYWDASALSLPNRVGMLMKLRSAPELHARMIFGTDYPLPSFIYPALLAGEFKALKELRALTNPMDRHAKLLDALGFSIPTGLPKR